MMRVASILLLVVVLLFLIASNNIDIVNAHVLCRGKEKEALLDFKLSFTTETRDVLSTWSIHNPECCEWGGVVCDEQTRHVVSLDVSANSLDTQQLRPSLLVLQHLTSLDLSGNGFTTKIPEFIGSLTKLTTLDLSNSGFFGKIPPHLGNLTRLQSLSLGGSPSLLYVDNLLWLSHLSSMQVLDLSGINLSNAKDWLSKLKMLPSLSTFSCPSCSLPLVVPPHTPLCLVNHSTSLQSLDLSNTIISSLTFSCLINGTHNLKVLNLAYTNLADSLPEFLGALVHSATRYALKSLDIRGNNPTMIPAEMMKFPSLQSLDISDNQLSEFTPPESQDMQKLVTLDISYNLMNTLPDLSKFSSLTQLDASSNRMKGNLHALLQHLTQNLTDLDLSTNSLIGVVLDAHFSKFSNLQNLVLSENYLLTFNFSRNWVPPFQLDTLYLSSCKLGPHFPNWVLTQKALQVLDISNSSISGAIPNSFWNYTDSLEDIDFSYNKFNSTLPNLAGSFHIPSIIDLSFNELHGPIPQFLFSAGWWLDLSNNKFSSFYPSHHEVYDGGIWHIDLSNNFLSGSLPNWVFHFIGILNLNLANNMLSGAIPRNIGSLFQLGTLHMSSNIFSGELPSTMKNCTQLTILELGNNNFTGSVPSWMGDNLLSLNVVNLRSNNFSGDLPFNLFRLQQVQVLDLSGNKISGSIPSCVDKWTSMTTYEDLSSMGFLDPADQASVIWKGILANESSENLRQRNVIDLSNNCLTGKIPTGVTSLKYLRSLDLSRNNLDGNIPHKIGELRFLEVLKLSSNRLYGEIPQSLVDNTFLNTLNLSSNNLSGRIPKSTQLQSLDPSSFAGNPKLCGDPLPTKCPGDVVEPSPPLGRDHTLQEANETFDMEAFYAALGTGFACTFLGILGLLNFHARSRHAFFKMASEVGDWIFVKISLCQSRIKRRLGF